MQAVHFCWGPVPTARVNLQWDIIKHESVVVITASEGEEGFEEGHPLLTTSAEGVGSPRRFVGDARFTVDSVSPHDGGVTFQVTIDWSGPLTLWTDVIVFNE